MRKQAIKTTIFGLIGNTFLFVIKLIAGAMTNSIAVISDAVNSFTDIIASVAVYISVKVGRSRADAGHPFGHRRAEPIAGLIIAIFAGILAFEILKNSIGRLIIRETNVIGSIAIIVLVATIWIKIFMALHMRKIGKRADSPAILASAVDSFNDVYISAVALVGVLGTNLGFWYLDSAAGIVISLYIFYSGYKIGKQNIDYLMGSAPSKENLDKIKAAAKAVKGVIAIHDVKAHYVGNFVHVEVHIEVDKKLNVKKAHAIGKNVEEALLALHYVDDAFIHIDAV